MLNKLFKIALFDFYSPENLCAPACHECEEPWPQVTCGIDGVTAVAPHRDADEHHQQPHTDSFTSRHQRLVPLVWQSHQTQQQQARACNLSQTLPQIVKLFSLGMGKA